jgi:hypothetical protein
MFTARNIQYEIGERGRGIGYGGIGAMHLLVRKLGLAEAIDDRLHLLKVHRPYHESDHVLNFAYNARCDGTCIQDIELRRNDEVFLDALGARRIPDPTTAGDFCRRFQPEDVHTLLDVCNDIGIKVWAGQPAAFFDQARIDADGTLVDTTGECKQGMDIAYNGTWGYHPLLVSLANTGEVLSVVHRSGNRPSHEGLPSRSIGPSAFAAKAASGKSSSAATPTSRRPSTWIAGTATACSSSSASTRRPTCSFWPTICLPRPGKP